MRVGEWRRECYEFVCIHFNAQVIDFHIKSESFSIRRKLQYDLRNWVNYGKERRAKTKKKKKSPHFMCVCFFLLMIKANKNVFYFEKQRLHYEIFSGCEVETTLSA